MINIEKKKECCGCRACESICPTSAISFNNDTEGFWYPKVDLEKCINCHKCEKTCPWLGERTSHMDVAVCYALKNKDIDSQINSSSGGVFPALANQILSMGGVIFGAQFDSLWQVESGYVECVNQLHKLRRSKYVQSNNLEAYKNVLNFLKEGRKVLFTGTPCQSLALRKYLHKDYENLYVVDIVCHGVPSPLVWNRYLNEISKKFRESIDDIKDIKFKYKDKKRYIWRHPGFKIVWKDDKKYEVFSNKTGYENGFLTNLFVRPSCHDCKIKKLTSSSDITIGDFWGVEKILPNFYDEEGVSIAMVQTERGRELFDAVKGTFSVTPITIDEATRYNQRIVVSSTANRNRNKFFSKLNSEEPIDEIVKRCLKPNKLSPCYIKNQLKKYIKDRIKL